MKFYYFVNRTDAERTVRKLRDIANDYAYATVADMKYLHAGEQGYYSDSKLGWSLDMLRMAKIEYCPVRCNKTCYILTLPEPVSIENFETNSKNDKTTNPINITIYTNGLYVRDHEGILSDELYANNPDEIISSVLKQVSKIKDRTVNITII